MKCVLDKKVKTNQRNAKASTKIATRPGIRTRDPSHSSQMLYLSATETTQQINWSQAMYQFQANGSKQWAILFRLYFNMHE